MTFERKLNCNRDLTDNTEESDIGLLCKTVQHLDDHDAKSENRQKQSSVKRRTWSSRKGWRKVLKRQEAVSHLMSMLHNNSFDAISIHKLCDAAAKGNLDEFQRLFEGDKTRLEVRDGKGLYPVHKAAEFGRINILQFIVDQGGNLNATDKLLNTPLHVAVRTEQVEAVQFLLANGADPSLVNDDEMAPIHLAVDINARKSLKALLASDKVDSNLRGEKGMRALHYCAYKDRAECAKMLLENGAKPCQKCDNGFFPINIAGKCAAAKTLEILIQHVEKLGYKREDVLSFTDKENNMPLHGAVNSGDLKAVQVCLSAGAPVDAKQEDSSTPLHFAAAQGSSDMVRLMHEAQPERFQTAIHTKDILHMTPLHRAAIFDHVSVVKVLLEHGSDIDARDINNRTPLILASNKGGSRTVQLLLEAGADISLKDKENRNFLHLAIKNGVPISNFGCAIITGLKNLLNERDDNGCTPLHYASREGHLVAIDDLIRLGAVINAKDNDKKSPLHFAARFGRFNTCRRLLDSAMGPNIINETDGDGMSPLHFAAQNGHTKIITLLMQKGAYVTKDNMDNSPLHHAAANGFTRSLKLLLTVYPNLLDCTNKDGSTALHLASKEDHPNAVGLLLSLGAKMITIDKNDHTFMDIALQERHSEVAFAVIRHDRWEQALKMCSKQYGTIMNGLVQCLPDVCMAALDKCQVSSKHDRKSRDLNIRYNFKYLQCPLRYLKGKDKDGQDHTPMLALNTMVRHGRVQCLSHPVSEAYLNMKWHAYGAWFHITNLIVYAIFLALVNVLVTTCTFSLSDVPSPTTQKPTTQLPANYEHSNVTSDYNITSNVTSTISMTSSSSPQPSTTYHPIRIASCNFTTMHKICVYVVFIFCILNFIKEIVQMFQQKKKYFADMTNLLEWILYFTTLLYISPFISNSDVSWQWAAGAIAVFLAWFNCLLFLRRFDFFGIYVVMFLEILRTLIQVLCVFSILLIAFAMAFYTLLNVEENRAFSTPSQSLLRTAMMMLELDFMASFNEPYTDDDARTLYFGGVTILLLVTFVLLMPILLMNLLLFVFVMTDWFGCWGHRVSPEERHT
ncbi:transient receptor potential cation channel subfamily A member 1-like isoform X2 [Mya arenaria]|uniref:transient receptor potential cation channel subfamily A member 1-like isoform X2 n=1 Tax=Mya arenaria TaxID=6604 RepID=UPI0022E0A7DC|nr:transient receptor potential cation channel subfamily A member 1-like isoform X2 [Mya arenaria]